MREAVLLHIPHSSTAIPPDVRAGILLNDDDLRREVLTIADLYTDQLFVLEGAPVIRNPWCRLVFDPERFRDDANEPMAAFGMGAIYVRTVQGAPMRDLAPAGRESMLERFYDPYHRSLEREVTRILEARGTCLIVDCHSFTSVALPFETDRVSPRPDICIGTCDFHSSEALAKRVEEVVARRGMSVQRNWPFSGTMTPMRYYRLDERVQSIMIEVNRRLYMDEATGAKSAGFQRTRELVRALLEELAA